MSTPLTTVAERAADPPPVGTGLRNDAVEVGTEAADSASCRQGETYGGQAVIEGVMMRGRNSWAIAVRRPSGGIARAAYPLESLSSRHRWLKWPVIRGALAMYESLSLGIKALGISANVGLEDPDAPDAGQDSVINGSGAAGSGETGAEAASADAAPAGDTPTDAVPAGDTPAGRAASAATPALSPAAPAFGWKELAVTVTIAVALAVGLFVVIPLFVVKYFEATFSHPFVFNLVEGVIRMVIFLLYILVISLLPDLRRVFQYHGAEHKVIHAYESCGRSDAEKAKGFSTLHPRCGTGFLLVVMVIAVFAFAIVGKPSLPWLVVSRLVGIPIIIGISYEIGIKWLGKHPNGFFARILLWPGLQLQRLTTREPSPDQIEVAAVALDEVMRMEAGAPAPAEESTVLA